MGYKVEGGGVIRVRDEAAALKAFRSVECESWIDRKALDRATTLAEAFASIFQVDEYEPGEFAIWHDDSWSVEYDEIAVAIGPYCETVEDVEWRGEDGILWRWHFTGTECRIQYRRIVYDEE